MRSTKPRGLNTGYYRNRPMIPEYLAPPAYVEAAPQCLRYTCPVKHTPHEHRHVEAR